MQETTYTKKEIDIIGGKKLLTVRESAYLLGVHRVTVHRMISRGKIQTIKIGRSTRIPVKEIDQFIKSNAKYRGIRQLPDPPS